MASVTMTSSFLGSAVAAASTARQPSVAVRRGSTVVMAKASKVSSDKIEMNKSEENGNGRRDMMFALAAAAACSVANIALADDEPKRGSAEAKKKYAQVCVTMPTARICRN
ncbi:Photosystem II 5 kDa protein, chloroplastic [Heracleum sosnowskyi]|uniref:Photosystem II 5 kDa protein, chloroplastic n=1 Tax=Heracleum sosnowskyi TaxID=360622 RepID=A0AAD8N5V2_9APIA|nr:Photosystem II 5 kDa protein, chloroplastic [Heracleum sosnowskyi]